MSLIPPTVSRHFHPMLPIGALKDKPVRVMLAGQPYAMFRDGHGKAAALVDRCPHRFMPLSLGRVTPQGRLSCSYHGWEFDAQGHGRSPAQPSLPKCNVGAMHVVERYGYVWMADATTPLAKMPRLHDDDRFTFAGSLVATFNSPVSTVLDNFSETEHSPYVHRFIGWTADALKDVRFEPRAYEDRSEVHYDGVHRPTPWARFLGVRPGDRLNIDFVTRFDPVRAVYTFSWFDPKTGARRPMQIRTCAFFVPETDTRTRNQYWVFVKSESAAFQWMVPFLLPAARYVAAGENRDDVFIMDGLTNEPFDLAGARLGKFDGPLMFNRKMMRSLYFDQGPPPSALKAQQESMALAVERAS